MYSEESATAIIFILNVQVVYLNIQFQSRKLFSVKKVTAYMKKNKRPACNLIYTSTNNGLWLTGFTVIAGNTLIWEHKLPIHWVLISLYLSAVTLTASWIGVCGRGVAVIHEYLTWESRILILSVALLLAFFDKSPTYHFFGFSCHPFWFIQKGSTSAFLLYLRQTES